MNQFPRHEGGEASNWPEKKKPKKRKYDVVKEAKVSGQQHISHVGNIVRQRTTGPDCRCKRYKCFEKFPTEERTRILEIFNQMRDKNAQDSHLCGLISVHHVSRRRPRSEAGNKPHNAVFAYKVRLHGRFESVCLKAFLSLHGITTMRVRRLQESLLLTGKPPTDKRGKHGNRPTKFPQEIVNMVKAHIKSFKGRQSHYSLRDNASCVYLPEGLSIKIMHSLFLEEFKINIPYKFYWHIFQHDFNIKFGFPRSDTCAECDGLNQKLKSENINDGEKVELSTRREIHLRKAEAFHAAKRIYKAKAQSNEITFLTFDFMQNLPLPHIPSNPVFFSRQLWYYIFGIHNVGNNEVKIFTYHEGQAKKGACDLTSMLFYYLRHADTLRNLVLASDGCPGQNKNYVMLHFLYILVHGLKMFDSITYIFPMRGHSYLPNDQDFALIEKRKRNGGIVEVPEEWDFLIKTARSNPSPFEVVKVDPSNMYNIKESTNKYFLKTPKPKVDIKNARIIEINKAHVDIKIKDSYHGPSRHCLIRNKVPIPKEIEFGALYSSHVQINSGKLENLRGLMSVLSDENKKTFYEEIFATQDEETSTIIPTSLAELDNDDNSSGCED